MPGLEKYQGYPGKLVTLTLLRLLSIPVISEFTAADVLHSNTFISKWQSVSYLELLSPSRGGFKHDLYELQPRDTRIKGLVSQLRKLNSLELRNYKKSTNTSKSSTDKLLDFLLIVIVAWLPIIPWCFNFLITFNSISLLLWIFENYHFNYFFSLSEVYIKNISKSIKDSLPFQWKTKTTVVFCTFLLSVS